jgi:hypothetical protein
MNKIRLGASLGAALICAAVPASIHWPESNGTMLSLNTAEARIGRPLTPGSVAGVNRRINRRAYYGAGAVAAGAVAAGAVAAGAYYGASAPYYGDYGYVGYDTGGYAAGEPAPYAEPVIVNPETGRWCRIESNGYRWCWTP